MCVIGLKNTFVNITCTKEDESSGGNAEGTASRRRDKDASRVRRLATHSCPPPVASGTRYFKPDFSKGNEGIWMNPPFECLAVGCNCKSRDSRPRARRRSSQFTSKPTRAHRVRAKVAKFNEPKSKLEDLGRGLRRIDYRDGTVTIFWEVPARKLTSTDKQVVSPPFTIIKAGQEVPFKLILFPVPTSDHHRGSCFKNSNDKGYMQLKCDGSPHDDSEELSLEFNFFVHTESEKKGPVRNNFFEKSTCGLPRDISEWNLQTSKEHLIVGTTFRRLVN